MRRCTCGNHGFDETVVRWSGTLDDLDAPPPEYAMELESPADGTREGREKGREKGRGPLTKGC